MGSVSKPTLRQLGYLVALADCLHFRKAAERAHVSQPTLSGQIAELEQRLGVELVERNRQRVGLTPAGQDVAARARQILSDVDALVATAGSAGANLGGIIRLGVLPTSGPYLLPKVIADLHVAYPELGLYVREDLPPALELGLADGHFDLLLTNLPVSGAFAALPLFREPLLLGMAHDHALAGVDIIAPEALRGRRLLALGQGHRLSEQVRQLARSYGADLRNDYEGTSLDTLRQMVGMGMGLSFFPLLYVRSEIDKDADVIARPLSPETPERTIGLVWRRGSPRTDAFVEIAELMRAAVRRNFAEARLL